MELEQIGRNMAKEIIHEVTHYARKNTTDNTRSDSGVSRMGDTGSDGLRATANAKNKMEAPPHRDRAATRGSHGLLGSLAFGLIAFFIDRKLEWLIGAGIGFGISILI